MRAEGLGLSENITKQACKSGLGVNYQICQQQSNFGFDPKCVLKHFLVAQSPRGHVCVCLGINFLSFKSNLKHKNMFSSESKDSRAPLSL